MPKCDDIKLMDPKRKRIDLQLYRVNGGERLQNRELPELMYWNLLGAYPVMALQTVLLQTGFEL